MTSPQIVWFGQWLQRQRVSVCSCASASVQHGTATSVDEMEIWLQIEMNGIITMAWVCTDFSFGSSACFLCTANHKLPTPQANEKLQSGSSDELKSKRKRIERDEKKKDLKN